VALRGRTRRGWKIYCAVVGLWLVIVYAVVAPRFRLIYVADVSITLPSYLGVWGYAFETKIGWRPLWGFLSFVFPTWDVLFNFVLSPESLSEVGVFPVLIALVLLVPAYVAIWRYAFRSPEIWRGRSTADR